MNAALAARKLKRRYGTPYLLWTHALEIMDEWLRASILPAMLDADLVITNSEFTRDIRRIGRCAAVADRENSAGSRSRSFSSRAGLQRVKRGVLE